MSLTRGDAVALTRELVRVDSRNPSLAPGSPGEGAVAAALAAILRDWGFRVELDEPAPGRPNVIARLGRGGGRSLMFNGHLDVVDVAGMTHSPFAAEEHDGRIYGRGSCDMKAGVAAMCGAAARVADQLAGELIIAAVVDEEYESLGTQRLVSRSIRADAAIVTEPTRLEIMPAHKGFAWFTVTVHGRAAHGSRWEIGVDAIRHAGLLLGELERLDSELLPRQSHALLGRPSVHASTIAGGTGMSTYPDRCVLRIERRSLPGETAEELKQEIAAACARVTARVPGFRADVEMTLLRDPSDVATDAPIARALSSALQQERRAVRVSGMTAWTDAAILNSAGIPAICFGPGDIALAHADEEFVPVAEIEQATAVLTRLALDWCGATA